MSSLLWRKFLECSSSPCSLRHPCVLTHSYGGSFWSVLPHCSLRHPCDLIHMTCLLTLTHSPKSSHRHPCVLIHITLVTTHPISVFSHTPTLIALTQVISHSHSHHLCYHAHSSPPVLTSLLLPLTHTSVLTLSVLTPIVIPDYSLPSLVLPCSLIPACSHITPTTTHSHECSHTECSHTHRHP